MAARGDLQDLNGVPIAAAETAPTDQLLIRLPEHGVLVAQDLVYHHTHSFVGNNDIVRWQVILEELADPAYDTVLPGHGLPAGQAVFR
jgi:glyoxylase-like metal-dependent hydrolase (beta-lactamase superfamily II)